MYRQNPTGTQRYLGLGSRTTCMQVKCWKIFHNSQNWELRRKRRQREGQERKKKAPFPPKRFIYSQNRYARLFVGGGVGDGGNGVGGDGSGVGSDKEDLFGESRMKGKKRKLASITIPPHTQGSCFSLHHQTPNQQTY